MTGNLYDESMFVSQEKDTPPGSGTDINNIASTLNWGWGHSNPHYGTTYGGWSVATPSNSTLLLTTIQDDVYYYNQGLVQNVDTKYFDFFNNHHLDHYDTAYGYYTDNGNYRVRVAEEWDPRFTYGTLSSVYGGQDPYGYWQPYVSTNEWQAVHYSPTHSLVS